MMKDKNDGLNLSDNPTDKKKENGTPGYPVHPDNQDIYKNLLKEEEINPEEPSKTKDPNSTNTIRRKDLNGKQSENDLDIPGSELDDLQEDIGSEDEENNYYSLGGDDHNDLEENQGGDDIKQT